MDVRLHITLNAGLFETNQCNGDRRGISLNNLLFIYYRPPMSHDRPLTLFDPEIAFRIITFRIITFRIITFRIVRFQIVAFRIVAFRIVAFRMIAFRMIAFRIIAFRMISSNFECAF